MYKVAVMGDRESIFGFAAVGLSVYPVTDEGEARHLIARLAQNSYAVIYITEKLAARIPDTLEKYRGEELPAIILIPGISGNTGRGMTAVHESVEKAVGSDILSN